MTDATTTDTTSTWDEVTKNVGTFLTTIQPLLDLAGAAYPPAAAALSIGEKIAQGVLSAEPTATALYKQFLSGTPPTPEQLKAYEDGYEADYQKLKADIAAQLAALPPSQ